jgi:hypothetical protein
VEPAKTVLTIALALALRAEPAAKTASTVLVPVKGTVKDDLGTPGEVWMQPIVAPVFIFRQLAGELPDGPVACTQRNVLVRHRRLDADSETGFYLRRRSKVRTDWGGVLGAF